MLSFQQEKNHWNIREFAIMYVLESLGGLSSYNDLKKYLVATKKDMSLLQKNIKKEIEDIPLSNRPTLKENFKCLQMSEPILIKVYKKLEKEKVIDRVSGRKKEKNKILNLFKINKKYEGYAENIDGTDHTPMFRLFLWNMIISDKTLKNPF